MTYVLNKKEIDLWCVKNSYAPMYFFKASDDYIAARCCILNGLFPGFMLASQSIEKLLKAVIYLETNKKNRGHNCFLLKEELKKMKNYETNYGIDKYDSILKKLSDHYQSRYDENPMCYGTNGACSDELDEIDKLWFELVEKMKMPEEVKYRMAFFSFLFESNPYWRSDIWIKEQNKTFELLSSALSKKYKEVFEHLYGKDN